MVVAKVKPSNLSKVHGFAFLLLYVLLQSSLVHAHGNRYLIETITAPDGRVIEAMIFPSPPKPPEGLERPVVVLPQTRASLTVSTLTEVPAFNWSFGCAATSAAMIAGYYDRHGFPNMYTGPTNSGVMPLNNLSWGNWVDPGGDTRAQCPLSATRNGLDGRAIKGHCDDYWIRYESTAADPYIGNWTQHTYGDCTGDYMKTNQSAYNSNIDGATTFYFDIDGDPITAANLVSANVHTKDGGYGIKLFYESRGYTVTAMYNQYRLGYNGATTKGFTYAQYCAEIDSGRPVMIHVEGHTMVGVGYDNSTNLVYLHDTWDHSVHTMTWGGSYSGMAHLGVSIVKLQGAINNAPVLAAIGSKSVKETQTLSFTVTATDPDAGNVLTLSAANLPVNATFNAGTGLFTWVTDYSDAGVYTGVKFKVVDNGSPQLSDSEVITITVNDSNRAPTDISLSPVTINENAGANATVGTISTTDQDAGQGFTYTLVSGAGSTDNAGFNISGASLRANASFDYETKNSYSVRIRTTDNGSPALYYEEAFTVTVNNVNDAPTDVSLSSASINENAGANATVGTLSTFDQDAGQTFTYTLVSGTGSADNTSFNISSATLRASASFDYETKSSYSVRVRTTDNGSPNLYFEEAFAITVNNVNEAPVLAAIGNKTVSEGSTLTFTISASDPETNTLSYSADNLPDNSTFNPATRVYTWVTDYSDAGTYSGVKFKVIDNGSPSLSDSESITITVSNYTFTVSVGASTGGSVVPSGDQGVNYGDTLNATATPSDGYRFVDWTLGGSVAAVENDSTGRFRVTGNGTVTANFALKTYTVGMSSNGNGTVTPSGNQTANHGDTLNVTAIPSAGYRFVTWTVTGGVTTVESDSTGRFRVTGPGSVTANFALKTYTVGVSSNGNGTVNPAGNQTVNHGDTLNVAALPSAGYRFVAWTVSGGATAVESDSTGRFRITGAGTVVANFAISAYTVSVSSNGNGTVTPSGNQTVGHGDTLHVVAIPSAGYRFVDWTVSGGVTTVESDSTGRFRVTAAGAITANFTVKTYIVSVSSNNNGTVTPSGNQTVNHGDTLNVTATPSAGYRFVNWTASGGVAVVETDSTGRFKVTGTGTITANFSSIVHAVTVSSSGNGTVQPTGSQNVAHGDTLDVTATPLAGFHFVSWTVSGGVTAVESDSTGRFRITANGTITALFDVASNIINNSNTTASLYGKFIACPNPVTGGQKVVLYYQGRAAYNIKLTIFDQVGNVVYHNTYEKVGGDDKRAMEFACWDQNNRNGRKAASGTYLAVLVFKDRNGNSNRLITKIGLKEE